MAASGRCGCIDSRKGARGALNGELLSHQGGGKAAGLRVALFSGNYNMVRDGANKALNRLVRYLLDNGAEVRVYSPTIQGVRRARRRRLRAVLRDSRRARNIGSPPAFPGA
jgi:hypothetical protein